MKIEAAHLKMLGKYLIKTGYQIAKGNDDKTFADVYDILNTAMLQLKKLQDTYEK